MTTPIKPRAGTHGVWWCTFEECPHFGAHDVCDMGAADMGEHVCEAAFRDLDAEVAAWRAWDQAAGVGVADTLNVSMARTDAWRKK